MKPDQLNGVLDTIKLSLDVELQHSQAIIDERQSEINRSLLDVRELTNSGRHTGSFLGSKYAEAIINLCSLPEAQDSELSSHDIIVDTCILPDIGICSVKAKLTAFGYKNKGPLDEGKIKNFEIVVGLCSDDNYEQLKAAKIKYPVLDLSQVRAPASCVLLLDSQSLGRDNFGDLHISDDFTEWAQVMLQKAAEPSNAPSVYSLVNIAQTRYRWVRPFME